MAWLFWRVEQRVRARVKRACGLAISGKRRVRSELVSDNTPGRECVWKPAEMAGMKDPTGSPRNEKFSYRLVRSAKFGWS